MSPGRNSARSCRAWVDPSWRRLSAKRRNGHPGRPRNHKNQPAFLDWLRAVEKDVQPELQKKELAVMKDED